MAIESEEKNESGCQTEIIVDSLLGCIPDNRKSLEDSWNERLNGYEIGEQNTY